MIFAIVFTVSQGQQYPVINYRFDHMLIFKNAKIQSIYDGCSSCLVTCTLYTLSRLSFVVVQKNQRNISSFDKTPMTTFPFTYYTMYVFLKFLFIIFCNQS